MKLKIWEEQFLSHIWAPFLIPRDERSLKLVFLGRSCLGPCLNYWRLCLAKVAYFLSKCQHSNLPWTTADGRTTTSSVHTHFKDRTWANKPKNKTAPMNKMFFSMVLTCTRIQISTTWKCNIHKHSHLYTILQISVTRRACEFEWLEHIADMRDEMNTVTWPKSDWEGNGIGRFR